MKTAISTLQVIGIVLGVVLAGSSGRAEFNYPQPPREGKAPYFTIAENGRARCCLVLSDHPQGPEVQAAVALQVYLQLATGASFDRCRENAIPAGLNAIHLGGTKTGLQAALDLPALRYGDATLPNVNGYLVRTVSPRVLVIRGATPEATLLGTVGLLKRYLGVRRYWPGEPGGLGDVVPKTSTLALPEIEWRDWSYFLSRTMSGCDERGPQNAASRQVRLYDFWRMHYTIPSNESYYRLMKSHENQHQPELFPLINRKRFVPKLEPGKPDPNGWQPCVSNPRVAEIMIDSLREQFRRNPSSFAMSLSVNDGYGDCMCPACCALDAPGADRVNRVGLCDRYVRFDNRVAEAVAPEFPAKILAFIAYGSMALPPTSVRLHPMLMPVLCVGRNAFGMWDDWVRTGAQHMGAYFYHDDAWFVMPKLDIHQSARRLRYMVASGRARSFYQEFYGIYPLDGLVGYVEQELLWDPRLSEDAILAEHYQKFFGPAAGPMKAFYAAIEAGYGQWLAAAGLPHPLGPDASSIADCKSIRQFSVLPPELADKAQAALQDAVAAAPGGSLEGKRVELVKTLFEFAALGSRAYGASQRIAQSSAARPNAAIQAVSAAEEAVDASLALADYKFDVMEKPEISAYEKHHPSDTFYYDLTRGSVHAEVIRAIDAGFRQASAGLTATRGPDGAAAWWRQQRLSQPRPVLRQLMGVAEFDAQRRELHNLVPDPSFEARGAKPGPPPDPSDYTALRSRGITVWASAGTPFQCRLSREEAHSGQYSVELSGCQHTGISEYLAVNDASCVRMSMWIKHNDPKGTYIVQTDPRAGTEHLPRATVEVPWKPGQWQQLEVLYLPQPGTKTVSFWLFVDRQSPGAKVWVDDFFIAKYPGAETDKKR
jgi:hypothetical protein